MLYLPAPPDDTINNKDAPIAAGTGVEHTTTDTAGTIEIRMSRTPHTLKGINPAARFPATCNNAELYEITIVKIFSFLHSLFCGLHLLSPFFNRLRQSEERRT